MHPFGSLLYQSPVINLDNKTFIMLQSAVWINIMMMVPSSDFPSGLQWCSELCGICHRHSSSVWDTRWLPLCSGPQEPQVKSQKPKTNSGQVIDCLMLAVAQRGCSLTRTETSSCGAQSTDWWYYNNTSYSAIFEEWVATLEMYCGSRLHTCIIASLFAVHQCR